MNPRPDPSQTRSAELEVALRRLDDAASRQEAGRTALDTLKRRLATVVDQVLVHAEASDYRHIGARIRFAVDRLSGEDDSPKILQCPQTRRSS
jgi:hypothetical protein